MLWGLIKKEIIVVFCFNVFQSHVLTCSHSSHMMVLVSSPTKMRSTKFNFTPSFPYACGEKRDTFKSDIFFLFGFKPLLDMMIINDRTYEDVRTYWMGKSNKRDKTISFNNWESRRFIRYYVDNMSKRIWDDHLLKWQLCCNSTKYHKMGLLLLAICCLQSFEPLTWRLVSSSAVFSVGLLKAFRIPAFTL